jgi:poly-gamma-glutamate capsule biosynthesis protein CapA/YwtB (metallophosphatase superfamily)
MASTNLNQAGITRVMFGGDVMLGRIVKKYILRSGPDYPLGQVANLMRAADLTIVNLECAITASAAIWPGAPKAFYFGAPPQAIESLTGAGIDMVSLANNHALDFGVDGLHETLQHLQRHGILCVGAGADIAAAVSPAIIEHNGMRFGMAAFCDHQADFAARHDSPGIAWLDLDDESAALGAWRKALDGLQRAAVDWPILSLHWGPNMVFRPSAKFCRLAHAAIDMGWKILFGHSAHVYQGLEIYRGCPIIYAAGDLVDDYYVDPEFRNDHQLLFEMELTRNALQRILLYPVFIEACRTQPADNVQSRTIVAWMTAMCKEMGTQVQQAGEKIWIEAAA